MFSTYQEKIGSHRDSAYSEGALDLGSTHSTDETLNPYDLDDNALEAAVENLGRRVRVLHLENEMMIRYLVRNAQYDENNLREQLDKMGERLAEMEMGRRTKTSSPPTGKHKGRSGARRSKEARESGSYSSLSMISTDPDAPLEKELQKKLLHGVAKSTKGSGKKKKKTIGEEITDELLEVVVPQNAVEEVTEELVDAAVPEKAMEKVTEELVDAAVPEKAMEKVTEELVDAAVPEKSTKQEVTEALLDAAVPEDSTKKEVTEALLDAAVPENAVEKVTEELVDAAAPENAMEKVTEDLVDAAAPGEAVEKVTEELVDAAAPEGKSKGGGELAEKIADAMEPKGTTGGELAGKVVDAIVPEDGENDVTDIGEKIVETAVVQKELLDAVTQGEGGEDRKQASRGSTALDAAAAALDSALEMPAQFGRSSMSSVRRASFASIGSSSAFLAFERRGPRLNVPGKAEMLTRELRDGRHDLEEFETEFAKKKLKLSELLEAASTMANELEHELDRFESEVAVGGVDPVTGRIPAERFVRHVSEWIRSTTQLTDKLRLRSTTLRVQLRKVRVQLKAKKELGETLTPVDFEQLRIDNERLLSTIEQKNLQVIELKRMSGDCALQLSVHKKALLSDRTIEDYLRSVGDERRNQCELMVEESNAVEEQNQRLKNRLESLRALTENFTAPPVLDYTRLCAKVADQERELRMWKRRVHLQETALRVANSNLRTSQQRLRVQRVSDRFKLQSRSDVDDVNCEAFQKFWFGGDSRAASRASSRPTRGGHGLYPVGEEGKGMLEEEDSWSDIPDSFFIDKGAAKIRPIPSPCPQPDEQEEEEKKEEQTPKNKKLSLKKKVTDKNME